MTKSLESIRGVAKAEGPVPAIAKSCKWTYVLKQKGSVSLILPKSAKSYFLMEFGVEIASPNQKSE